MENGGRFSRAEFQRLRQPARERGVWAGARAGQVAPRASIATSLSPVRHMLKRISRKGGPLTGSGQPWLTCSPDEVARAGEIRFMN